MDVFALLGIVIAFGAVIGGNFLEGGHMASLVNAPATVIVIGGTFGAVILQTPWPRLQRAARMLSWVVVPPKVEMHDGISKLKGWSKTARREGILGLENILEREADTFARKGLEMLVDGGEPHTIRHVLETDLASRSDRDQAAASVFKALGGYAPTIGIIGAVMGLIHVMGNLADPAQLGNGIATAFVATIYGIGLANLVFLPIADRLRATLGRLEDYRVMMIEGILAIAEGENPRTIELRLQSFLEV